MYIQMVTALVLQLIQCVVHLPSDKDAEDHCGKKVRPGLDTPCTCHPLGLAQLH